MLYEWVPICVLVSVHTRVIACVMCVACLGDYCVFDYVYVCVIMICCWCCVLCCLSMCCVVYDMCAYVSNLGYMCGVVYVLSVCLCVCVCCVCMYR